jgi:hypothetical protein
MSLLGIFILRQAEETGQCIISLRRLRSIMNGVLSQRQIRLHNTSMGDDMTLVGDEVK